MGDTNLDTQVGHRLQHMRNGVMGVVRISDFCRDTHDFKAADEVLQRGVEARYEHLTTLQEAQVVVLAVEDTCYFTVNPQNRKI